MVTAGIFLLLRLATVLNGHLSIVAISGAFSIVFGGMVAVFSTDVKQIIA
jgi:NADH:ubiquinone oxidoreductase subunit 5 (subunit L)/multisubunit Na+/H+ antiporter MnhA subunit